MGDLRTLVKRLESEDHWECLELLRKDLVAAANNIHDIHVQIEGIEIYRRELPEHLVRAYILIELSKVKLSVMANEWNSKVDEVVKDMMSKLKTNFDDMEF